MGYLRLSTTNSSGERRFFTLTEWVKGAPLGHPSHTLFVHFPLALLLLAVVFDAVSLAGSFPEAPYTASWLIVGGLAGGVLAVVTGLVDWWGMIKGSRKRRWTTWHLWLQLAALAIFAIVLALRWPARVPEANGVWIVLGLLGLVVMFIGSWIGGILVYRMGMRVSTGPEG